MKKQWKSKKNSYSHPMARKMLPEVLSLPSPLGYDCPKLLVSTLTPEKRNAPPRIPRLAESLTTHIGVSTIPPACKIGSSINSRRDNRRRKRWEITETTTTKITRKRRCSEEFYSCFKQVRGIKWLYLGNVNFFAECTYMH